MNIKNVLLITALFIASARFACTQESESKISVDVSADIVSRYVWRGINLSGSPAIQPSLSLNLYNVSIGSWASYSFSPELYQEVDLYVTYETRFVSLTINDYYNPVDTLYASGDYFHLGKASTRHTLEGMVTLHGPEAFPVSLLAGIMFYGNDRNEEGHNLYSTYLELNYSGSIRAIELIPFIGITPSAGYYGDKFGTVNMGITAVRNIKISEKYQIPVKGSFIINPQQEKIFFVIGITF
jgi:predicted small secreted protein